MSDGVKFIFKTLIKIPIIVMVCYLVLNVFAFSFSYFRLLGYSYMAMHTAVENNYLPASELSILENSIKNLETGWFDNLSVQCDTDVTGGEDSDTLYTNKKVQYGTEIRIKVTGYYHFILPLMKADESATADVEDMQSRSSDQIQAMMDRSSSEISFIYTVPGLKYYPDMQ